MACQCSPRQSVDLESNVEKFALLLNAPEADDIPARPLRRQPCMKPMLWTLTHFVLIFAYSVAFLRLITQYRRPGVLLRSEFGESFVEAA